MLHLAGYYIYGSSHEQRKQTFRIVWIPPLRPIIASESLQRSGTRRFVIFFAIQRLALGRRQAVTITARRDLPRFPADSESDEVSNLTS